MDISFWVNVIFLASLLCGWCIMLRRDMFLLQQHQYHTGAFYDAVRSSDETYSTKRVALLAIFMASTTSYATDSWMVMALLCAGAIAVFAHMYARRMHYPIKCNKRFGIRYFPTMSLPLLVGVALAVSSADAQAFVYQSILAMLFFTCFSYAFSLCVNWCVGLFSKKD